MINDSWIQEFPCAITVVDTKGKILEMNDRSAATFAADGGSELIGKSVFDCHPEPALTKLKDQLAHPQRNIYTIEKAGVKKMICQIPWYRAGLFAGVVELSIELPAEIPHFKRD
jgi:transcriptional regulator with PAS, ATPase and Fis domain